MAGGRSFAEFHDAYIDGRAPYPWAELLPLVGLELSVQTDRVARIGISTSTDDDGVHIVSVVAGGAASSAGVQAGDDLLEIGGIAAEDATFGAQFRDRFGDQPTGTPYDIVVHRDGQNVTLEGALRFADVTTTTLQEDPNAGEKARRIRNGILTGSTGS